jgi:hypothetical protein
MPGPPARPGTGKPPASPSVELCCRPSAFQSLRNPVARVAVDRLPRVLFSFVGSAAIDACQPSQAKRGHAINNFFGSFWGVFS